MKKSLFFLIACFTILACNKASKSVSKFSAPEGGKYIEWFGDNDLAIEFAMIGVRHFMNAEQEKLCFF